MINRWGVARTNRNVDLRQWFDSTVKERSAHDPDYIGMWVLHRQMRLTENSNMVECVCNVNKEAQRNPRCSSCLGEGYLWDEHLIKVFKVERPRKELNVGGAGVIAQESIVFYLPSNMYRMSRRDRLVEISLDEEGNIVKPIRRFHVHYVGNIDVKRGNDGKVEYVKATMQ